MKTSEPKRTPHVILQEIHWVSRPSALRKEIDEATDLCRECAALRVEKYQKEFPEHADDIEVGGGRQCSGESETLPYCDDCHKELACYLIDGVESSRRWGDKSRNINTLADWRRAERRMLEKES